MRKPILISLAAALLSAVAFAPAFAADDAAPAMPAAGQPAPTFTLPSQDGTPISLKSLHGKWVVLYFYPRDMTTGCTIEAHKFQDSLPQFEAKHAVVLGVSVDSKEMHQQFCTKDSLTFRLLSDTDHKVVSAYGSLNGPQRRQHGQPQHLPDQSQGQDREGVDQGEPGGERLGGACRPSRQGEHDQSRRVGPGRAQTQKSPAIGRAFLLALN